MPALLVRLALPSSSFQGVYANAQTLEHCRETLQEVLEGWIILGLRLGHTLPVVDGIALTVEKEAV